MNSIKNKVEQLLESPFAVLVIGVVIIVTNIFLFVPSASSLRKNVSETEKASARIALAQINAFLEDKKGNIEVSSRYMRENLVDIENKLILQKILKDRYFTSVSLVDIQGNEILKYDKFKTMLQSDMGDIGNDVSFKEALNTKNISWSKVTFSETFEPSITINVPVFSSKNKIIAVLTGTLGVSSVFESISDTNFPNDTRIYVVDRTGALISTQDLSLVLKGANYSERKIVKDTLTSTGGAVSSDDNKYVYINENNVKVLAAGARVQSTGWGVIVEEPKNIALKNINRLITSTLVGFFVVISLIFLIRKINLKAVEAQRALERNLLKQQGLLREVQKSKDDIEESNASLLENDRKLAEKVQELESYQKFVVGREIRMVELKQEIEVLKKR